MASGLVIHISSGDDRHTEILTDDRIRIGTTEDCELRLRSSSLPKEVANSIVIELARYGSSYRVADFEKELQPTRNGEALAVEDEIRDGDDIRLDHSGLSLQFFRVRSLPAVIPQGSRETHVAPFIEAAAIESAATARRDDAKVFLREFTRELVREIKPSTKLITLAMALLLVGGVLYLGFAMYKEMERSRRLIDDQRAQLGQMRDQVKKTNDQLSDLGRSNKEIRDSLSLDVKLRSDYGKGVALIAGSFYYVEPGTGRPLRYQQSQVNESGSVVQSGD